MAELKDILYYGTMAYLSLGISYCAVRDLYNFTKEKIKSYKEKKRGLEFRLNKDNDIY